MRFLACEAPFPTAFAKALVESWSFDSGSDVDRHAVELLEEGEARSMRLRPGNLEEVELASLRGLPAALHLLKRWNGEAVVLFHQGRYEKAQLVLERALEVDPRHVPTLRSLGTLHAQQGRPEEARRLWERGLEVIPNDRAFQSLLASLADARG